MLKLSQKYNKFMTLENFSMIICVSEFIYYTKRRFYTRFRANYGASSIILTAILFVIIIA